MDDVVSRLLERFGPGTEPVDSLDATLTSLGWQQPSRGGESWAEWFQGDLVGTGYDSGPGRSFTVVTRYVEPDEGDDFEALYETFESEMALLVGEVAERLGPATSTHRYDDPEPVLPEAVDRATVWAGAAWNIAIAFHHEDKEVPLRLGVWVYENH